MTKKALVVFPSRMTYRGKNNTNGLMISGRENALLLKEMGYEVSILAKFDEDYTEAEEGFGMVEFDHNKRTHNRELLRTLMKIADQYDLVHMHCTHYLFSSFGKSIAENPDVDTNFVLTFHSPFFGGITAHTSRPFFANSFKDPRVSVTYPGERPYHEAMKFYGIDPNEHPFHLISNIFETYESTNIEKSIRPQILVITRIDPGKNPISNVSKAIRDARAVEGARVVVVGNTEIMSDSNKSMKRIIDDFNILVEQNSDIVTHRLSCTRDEIQSLLEESTILYHYSLSECQSLVPVEAMSVGCNVAGFEEIIPHVKNSPAILLSLDDKTKAFEKSNPLIETTQNVSSQECIKFVQDNFNRDKLKSVWNDFYLSLPGMSV